MMYRPARDPTRWIPRVLCTEPSWSFRMLSVWIPPMQQLATSWDVSHFSSEKRRQLKIASWLLWLRSQPSLPLDSVLDSFSLPPLLLLMWSHCSSKALWSTFVWSKRATKHKPSQNVPHQKNSTQRSSTELQTLYWYGRSIQQQTIIHVVSMEQW